MYIILIREADDLNFRGLEKVEGKHLHTLTDSFMTGMPILPWPGNYLFIACRRQ